MAPSVEAILKDSEFDPTAVERISYRETKPTVEIVPYNPTWPQRYAHFQSRILSALGDQVLDIRHVGSTSVPGLSAKDVIDIDLVVRDNTDEASYVSALEAAGFQFLFREPRWHQHRFFCTDEPMLVNLHVWGPDCPEVERHSIFRDWLIAHEEERALYVEIKEQAARQTRELGEVTQDYNLRKENVIREILKRAFKAEGYLPEDK